MCFKYFTCQTYRLPSSSSPTEGTSWIPRAFSAARPAAPHRPYLSIWCMQTRGYRMPTWMWRERKSRLLWCTPKGTHHTQWCRSHWLLEQVEVLVREAEAVERALDTSRRESRNRCRSCAATRVRGKSPWSRSCSAWQEHAYQRARGLGVDWAVEDMAAKWTYEAAAVEIKENRRRHRRFPNSLKNGCSKN